MDPGELFHAHAFEYPCAQNYIDHLGIQLVDRLVGDRHVHRDTLADVDLDVSGRLAFGNGNDPALDLVAGTELDRSCPSAVGA